MLRHTLPSPWIPDAEVNSDFKLSKSSNLCFFCKEMNKFVLISEFYIASTNTTYEHVYEPFYKDRH